MKGLRLVLFALSSMLIGYIYNLSFLIPIIGILLYWLMPFAYLIYWFWVGGKFAESIRNPIIAIIYGNIFGIISLLVYVWQFTYLIDSQRNIWLAAFSQAFSSPISRITAKIGVQFEAKSGMITQASINVMQASGLILMVLVFAAGYLLKRKALYKNQKLDC